MSWLVTGGAGYIGRHVVNALQVAGEHVVVLDDLTTGRPETVTAPLVHADVGDRAALDAVFRRHQVRGVVHLAAHKQVGESVADPLRYYRANVGNLVTLLEAMRAHGVDTLVFSSSAAVYGTPDVPLVTEQTPTLPVSPYGETKLIGEWLIRDAAAAYGLRYALLRYFNVAGSLRPELSDTGVTNLVPMVFQRLTSGLRPLLFGGGHPTPDGTCVRDFVHVDDVASAHVAALRHLVAGGGDLLLNVGRGHGASVREVLDVVGRVTGLPADPDVRPARAGDPPRVVAATDAIERQLGWTAVHGLEEMVASAWAGWTAGWSARWSAGEPAVPAPRLPRAEAGASGADRRALEQGADRGGDAPGLGTQLRQELVPLARGKSVDGLDPLAERGEPAHTQ
jgi:UDP-glucose 4-epimerase